MADLNNNAFIDDASQYGTKTKPVPVPEKNIGIDTDNSFFADIIDAGESGQLDISKLESFTQISQSREQLYQLLDTMAEDSIISAVLETYAEDATERNEDGRIVWCESDNPDIVKYITYLLDTMNVDKHSYKWVHSLCKYGDLYLRLFRESDIDDGLFENGSMPKKALHESKENLHEDVNIIAYNPADKYVHYIDNEPNPAEMFELVKFGKSYAYIKAPTSVLHTFNETSQLNNQYKYSFQKTDVDIFDAQTYVHGALEDSSNRSPETVEILNKTIDGKDTKLTYNVRRGQSLLYNTFKIWRQMMLLENSLLLNRITKSSIVRIIGVEVGDMPKEEIGPKLRSIKSLIEQKTAINQGNDLSEYTNPGPMENNVYVPTKNGIGALTTQQVGGDVDVKGLADIDYFRHRLFGSMRVPQQYFGFTDDDAGFSGGTSLSIISSRYAKMVKRIQNTYIQTLTDAVNLMLLDKGLDSYVNKFELHMVPPTTQEEIDRRDNMASKVQITSDIMNLLDEVEDKSIRIKILQSLLSKVVNDAELLQMLSDYAEEVEAMPPEIEDDNEDIDINLSPSGGGLPRMPKSTSDDYDIGSENAPSEPESEPQGSEEGAGETILPTPDQLGAGDFTNNDMEF